MLSYNFLYINSSSIRTIQHREMRRKRTSKAHKSFIKKLFRRQDPKAFVGIYKITCSITEEFYIGSSTDISKRWKWHLYELKNKVHGNYRLQGLYNTHGEKGLTFEIIWKSNIKPMDRVKLYEIEQGHIDRLKPTINIELIVSIDGKRAAAKARPAKIKALKGNDQPLPQHKPKKKQPKNKKYNHLKRKDNSPTGLAKRIAKAIAILNAPPRPGGVNPHKRKHTYNAGNRKMW